MTREALIKTGYYASGIMAFIALLPGLVLFNAYCIAIGLICGFFAFKFWELL